MRPVRDGKIRDYEPWLIGALAGVVVSAFEIDSAWPMVLTMLGVSLAGNLALRCLIGRAAPPALGEQGAIRKR